MRKIILIIFIFSITYIPSYAFEGEAINHETGKITMSLNGNAPYQIYQSIDNENFTLIGGSDSDLYSVYGLEGGNTYYFRIVDSGGGVCFLRYSVPAMMLQKLPLSIVDIRDNEATIYWDMYDFKDADIYVNGSVVKSVNDLTSYTLNNLTPNTEYRVYLKNKYDVQTNTICFRTTNFFDKLQKLFASDLDKDSDNDGIPDWLEPIMDKLNEILDKIGGGTINDVANIVNDGSVNIGDGDINGIPKIETTYKGLHIKVFDLNDPRLSGMIHDIRLLCLAIVTIMFIFLVLTFFNVTFKV